jgi:hypothetical protein
VVGVNGTISAFRPTGVFQSVGRPSELMISFEYWVMYPSSIASKYGPGAR